MGKGNRNSQQRIEEQLANEEKLLAKENAKKSKKKKDKLVATACVVVALLIVAVLVLNVLSTAGVFIRSQKAMYVEGNDAVTVNGAMMTFFINDAYEQAINSFYENYYYYILLGYMDVDLSSSLAAQVISSTSASYLGDSKLVGKTWYDYFMDNAMDTAIQNAEMYVVYANAAKNIAECALDEDQVNEIKTNVKKIKKSLKESGMNLSDQYGKGVTESDIRECYELMYLASNYAEYLQDKKDAEFKDQTDVLNKFVDENKGDFITAEYLSYTINVSEKTEGSESAYDIAVEKAVKAAEDIKKATNPEEFAKAVLAYKESLKTSSSTTATTAATKEASTEENTEEETTNIQDVIDDLTETKYYETENDVDKWMFETAETNDVYLETVNETVTETEKVTEKTTEKTTETATETKAETETGSEEETTSKPAETKPAVKTYKKFSVTVYMLTKAPDRDYAETHNLAYLITDNKAAAEKFMTAFLASNKSADKFEELAEKYYNELHGIDEDGEHNHDENEAEPVFSYSRDERVKEKYFADDYDAINQWLDSADRKAGEYTEKLIEIKIDETDSSGKKTTKTYYAAVLFEGHDLKAWHADALSGVIAENVEEWYEEESKKVTHNTDLIYSLVSQN